MGEQEIEAAAKAIAAEAGAVWPQCAERYRRYAHAALTTAQAEIEALRGALRPFAECCEQISDDEDDEEWAKFRLLIKDYRRARAALSGSKP